MAVDALLDASQVFMCSLSAYIQMIGSEENALKAQRLEGIFHQQQL
jgi:hypothetical protein